MKLNNNSKIITDDDILMSGRKESLSDIISTQLKLLDELRSNLKWIYKYGGVGSGNNGGGGPVLNFSIYASLNNIQLKDQTIVLNKEGLYNLNIKINNPNGALFNVKYTYTTKSSTGSTIKLELTIILNIENNYVYETSINLNNNDNLQITVSDGNETKQVMCSYVTSPYDFTLSLEDDEGVKVSDEHFIEVAAKKGVNVLLKYLISVPASIHYKYTFLNQTIEGDILDSNNTIKFPIAKDLFVASKAGYYTALVDLEIIPEGLELIKQQKSISFSLIPEDLYMLIQPIEGIIYETEENNPFEYTPGYLTFNYRIYEGISLNRTYTVDIKLNNVSILNKSVIERLPYSFKLFSVQAGLNKLDISISRTSTYRKTYYFYILESSIALNWFDNPHEWTQYYYRINEVTDNFNLYLNKLYIEQTVNTPPISIKNTNPPNVSANALINTHIAIGLLFNTINGEDPVLLNFYNTENGSSPILSIQQSQVIKLGLISNFYIKKQANCNKDKTENYHLIQIYSQYIKKIEKSFYYETSLYIDGILESVFGLLSDYPLLTDSFQIEPTNCFINLLEVDYKKVEENTVSNCDYEVYKYYIKYKNAILREDIGSELLLIDYIKNFNVGLNGRVTINEADINNIAKNIETPVLLMTYQDDGQFNSLGGFMEALEAGYGEDGTGVGSDMNFQVTVSWGSGKNSVDEVQYPAGFENARFRASLQGSSTKMYRVKNFNLSIENTTGTELDEVYLFSPNFEDGNTKSFLPETEFTLKADVVDSSHSNNTSCGRFINTVCRKFSKDIIEDGYYKNYIKNCLDGFPTLLYLCHVIADKESGELKKTYYYLGVYNFNLGRTSYYNLGYKDLSVFGSENNKLLVNAGNSFSFFKISAELNILKLGLGVAEIQGGDPHFDFSQWDPTVLFQQIDTDSRYMFGDLVYGSNGTEQQLKTALSRLVEKVAKSGGYLFDFLKKKKGLYETSDIREGSGYNAEIYDSEGHPTGESKNQVPDYTKQYEKYLAPTGAWEFRLKSISPIKGTLLDLQDLIIPDIDTGKLATLNFLAVSEYYTICMVLGLVDSVMKNLNIKTWNAKPDGTATWYPAFYDMDTCLGINNLGNPISYFAFSDYWHSQITKTVNDVEYPSAVKIYRDFSPHSLGENGYDVPTNYLFTVAKYAKLIFTDNTSEQSVYLSLYPLELYAKWRSGTENPETNEGILKNADSFMNNFFANNLASICPALVSYNYRSKYLKLANEQDIIWVLTDYNKFNGTRVNKVHDWLEGRLHILDVYFNLNRSMPLVITYRTEEGKWETLMNGNAPVVDTMYSSNYNLENNEDVVILKDIFSAGGGSGVLLSGFISFQIRCPEFSPLLIYNQIGSVHENFILGGAKNQQVQFTPTGVLNVKLGGSQAWSYLQDINWITTSGLYITSDKLENITGNSGKFTSLQLKTPNVKTISLTSRNYSGSLNLDSTSNYPNLTEINISGSLINLTANSLNIKSLNISNMDAPNSSVTIINCNSIQTLNTANIKLRSLLIEGLKGNLKNFNLRNTNVNNINIRCGEIGGIFTLDNDRTVTSLVLGDFLKVIITNCPKLSKITINKKTIQDLEELLIINCSANNIAITSEAQLIPGKMTLSNTVLKRIKCTNLTGITEVELPSDIELLDNAFLGCINLLKVTGNNIYLSKYAFDNCKNYNLKDNTGSRTKFKIKSTTTELTATFRNTLATWEDVIWFINNIIPTPNNIIDVLYLFSNTLVSYGLEELKKDLQNDNYPQFNKLNKVEKALYLFFLDINSTNVKGVQAINKKFMDMGSIKGCNYSNAFLSRKSQELLYLPINVFENSISKILEMPFGNWAGGYSNCIVFINIQGDIISEDEEIKVSNLFNPNGLAPTKLISLSNFRPYGNYILDWTNTFTLAWSSLTSINNVCDSPCKYKGYELLLKNVPNPVNINESWNTSTLEDVTADYYEMYNWDKQCTLPQLFSIAHSRHIGAFSNNCNKFISADNYILLCEKILKSKTLTSILAVFRNTTVIGALSEWTFGNTINSKIKDAALAFDNFKNKTTADSLTNNYLMLSKDFCKTLPLLANVMGMFKDCKLGKAIPFNLFKKRTEILEKVWVKNELDSYEEAILYRYNYNLDMYDMSYLFYNCEWNTESLQYEPSLYNIPKVRVLKGEKSYTEYYTRTLIPNELLEPTYSYTKHTIEQPTEITDAENLKGGYVSKISETPITNPVISGDLNKLIIPPDLFYGLLTNIDNIESQDFSLGVYKALHCKTSLNGIIPPNIFKNNKTVKCNSLWQNLIIIPRLIKTWSVNNTIYNVYLHYPENYTKYPNLDDAFNSELIVLEDTNIADIKTINYSLVLLENSIPKLVSTLSNAFLTSTIRWSYIGQSIKNKNYQFNFIGKLVHNNIILGLDPSYFTNLNMNNLFHSNYIMVANGNLFASSFDAAFLKLSNFNDTVLSASANFGYVENALSRNLIMPKTTKIIPLMANNRFKIYPDLIVDSSTSIKFYEQSNWLIQTSGL